MASSLPAIGYSIFSGSQFVSTMAMIGIFRRLASATAISSRSVSMTTSASGSLSMFTIPSRLWRSLAPSRRMAAASALLIFANAGVFSEAWISFRRATLFRMVVRLVSVPPSQRWFTKSWPVAVAASRTASWACFLVPTKRILPPPRTIFVRYSVARES